MWNLLRSDVYRFLHTRSTQIVTLLYVLMLILLVSTTGVVSNTAYASFDASTDSLVVGLPVSGPAGPCAAGERGIPERIREESVSICSEQMEAGCFAAVVLCLHLGTVCFHQHPVQHLLAGIRL